MTEAVTLSWHIRLLSSLFKLVNLWKWMDVFLSFVHSSPFTVFPIDLTLCAFSALIGGELCAAWHHTLIPAEDCFHSLVFRMIINCPDVSHVSKAKHKTDKRSDESCCHIIDREKKAHVNILNVIKDRKWDTLCLYNHTIFLLLSQSLDKNIRQKISRGFFLSHKLLEHFLACLCWVGTSWTS